MTASLLFNSTLASSAISSAFELGLFEALHSVESISIDQFCQEKKIDRLSFESMLYAMNCFEILQVEKGEIKKGRNFAEIDRNKGYFHWMIKGYGDFLVNSTQLLRKEFPFKRDGAAIARSGRDYGAKFVDDHVRQVLKNLQFKKMADLGCGSANRILEMVKEFGCEAVGVEINPGGVEVAREAVKNAGLSDQVQIIHGDVTELQFQNEFQGVDLISSFFMGHDLWPRERCIEIFKNFRKVFPDLRYFLFCDTFRSGLPPQQTLPTFTLGFEVFHAFMGQYIPTVEEWRALFKDAGWQCNLEIETEIPFTHLFLLE